MGEALGKVANPLKIGGDTGTKLMSDPLGLFAKKDTPTPPAPAAAAPVISAVDAQTTAEANSTEEERRRRAGAGRAAGILTSPLGTADGGLGSNKRTLGA